MSHVHMHKFDALSNSNNALSFLISQISHIEQEVYHIRYPDITYQTLIPVDTSAFEWAKTVTYFSHDRLGEARWLNHLSSDMPFAEMAQHKHETEVELAGIGYRYTLEEISQAMVLPNLRLTADKAQAARRASEEYIERVAFNGDPKKNFYGLFNHPDIPIHPAKKSKSGDTSWFKKTPQEILNDLNEALTKIITRTQTVELADTLLLPVEHYNYIATLPRSDVSDMTILSFFKANNIYTATTGTPLLVRQSPHLMKAGQNETSRLLVYRRAPEVLKLHIPMPHRFLPPQQALLQFIVPGIFRFGGLDVRLPQALAYVDGL